MTNEIIFYCLTILLFLLISAFFSAAETALTAVSRARIYQLVMEGDKAAAIVSRLRQKKESLIGTVLLANTAVNIGASALATVVAIKLFGDDGSGVAVMTVAMTMITVIFVEVLPKTYAIHNAETVSLRMASKVSIAVRVLHPITWSVQHFIRMLFTLFGVDITKTGTLISATDVIRGTIELHHREGKMVKQDRDMLGSILDLNDVEVREIMTHRKQVETVDADLPVEELVAQVVSTMHSRVPLWRGEPDNIIGMLHVKNLIKLQGAQRKNPLSGQMTVEAVIGLCTKPWFIPDTTSLREQLLAFRSKRQHFAFVVDEYGGWQGIVTLEDIIEEIVGDIEDEHDEMETDIQRSGDNAWYVSGSVSIRDLNRRLDWNLPDDNASTIAGLLIHEAQTIPSVGERFHVHDLEFTVMEKDGMQITRLYITKPDDTAANAEA
jgi:Mg2+/Co2+ transporter CorB